MARTRRDRPTKKKSLPRRTSANDPLRIDEIPLGRGWGKIGLTLCPGKKDTSSFTAIWDRDLDTDLDAVRAWGAGTVITLIEEHEFRMLRVQGLRDGVLSRGMTWRHYPIRDVSVPRPKFDRYWDNHLAELRTALEAGENVLIHCRGGLGRAGMVACRLLQDLGREPDEALKIVRRARPGAVETEAQEDWVLNGCESEPCPLPRPL